MIPTLKLPRLMFYRSRNTLKRESTPLFLSFIIFILLTMSSLFSPGNLDILSFHAIRSSSLFWMDSVTVNSIVLPTLWTIVKEDLPSWSRDPLFYFKWWPIFKFLFRFHRIIFLKLRIPGYLDTMSVSVWSRSSILEAL